jgi:NAD(P)-dependent dehydrogenase (short-subunit alcohol dehydrogenase family)
MASPTALIVGGTSGVGLATARLLADRGADVHTAGRSQDRLDAIAAVLRRSTG